MAYIRLADGSTFQGLDDGDVAKAVAAYMSKNAETGGLDISKITISPEVTKIVEKVPIQVDKIIEKAVQVPVLPERPLTTDEINLIKELRAQTSKDSRNAAILTLGVIGLVTVGVGLIVYMENKHH